MKNRYLALWDLKNYRNIYYDDTQIYSIKRTLLIFASTAIAVTLVSPDNQGIYKINMGIIQGNLNNPLYLYLFLAVVCLYYLLWMHAHTSKLIANNFNNLVNQFMFNLSSMHAKDKFMEMGKKYSENWNGTPDFKGRSGSGGTYISSDGITEHALRNHIDFKTALINGSEFNTKEYKDQIELLFTFTPTSDDLKFFNIHKNLCCILRRSDWFIIQIPMIYGVVAEVIIVFHIIQNITQNII